MTRLNTILPQIESLLARYRSSPLAEFLQWWGRELYGLIPASLRRRLVPPQPELWLLADAEDLSLQVWRGGREPEALDTFGGSEDPASIRQRWHRHMASFDDGPPEVALLLPADSVLDAPVELPLAVESNLGPAVTYQLDQLTPFRADQVWHDFQVVSREPDNGRIKLDLRLIPHARLDPLTKRLDEIGIRPHALDVAPSSQANGDPDRGGFNLLPAARRPAYVNRRVRLNWALGLAAGVLLTVVMALSLHLRTSGVEQLRAEVDALRAEADSVTALQRELDDALDAANFLAEHRAEQPVVMHVLDELTRVLPNDLWLTQVRIDGRELTIQGSGSGSDRLVELIDGSSKFSDTEIRGSVTIDPNTGQERFNANATITPWGLENAVVAGP